jgi:hypothetical protein
MNQHGRLKTLFPRINSIATAEYDLIATTVFDLYVYPL